MLYLLAQLPEEVLKEQLGNGVILMVLGMAIVFVFLTILVFSTKWVSKIVKKFESNKPVSTAKEADIRPVFTASSDAEIAAAIAAAVVKSRS